MSPCFTSGGRSIGASTLASVLPMNTQNWSPLGWAGWISMKAKGLSESLLQHHSSKASIFQCSAFFIVQLSHPYMTTGKNIALIIQTFFSKVMCLLFNMLSRFVIAFLQKSKCLFAGDCPWRVKSWELLGVMQSLRHVPKLPVQPPWRVYYP